MNALLARFRPPRGLPRLDLDDLPRRFLARRVLQAIVREAGPARLWGRREAPAHYVIVRLVHGEAERAEWEAEWEAGRADLEREVGWECRVREIDLPARPDLAFTGVTPVELDDPTTRERLARLTGRDGEELKARLLEARELILPAPLCALEVTTDPPGAQAYLDGRPVGVTPVRVEALPAGIRQVLLVRPGYVAHTAEVAIGNGSHTGVTHLAVPLEPEPPMRRLEIRTAPPRAEVQIGEETRVAPCRWRLPAGEVQVLARLPGFQDCRASISLPPGGPSDDPHPAFLRLDYAGEQPPSPPGRLVVYRPGSKPPRSGEIHPSDPIGADLTANIREFFLDSQDETPETPTEGDILGQFDLPYGVTLIGRPDPDDPVAPDVRLLDESNSVSRGCHAWLWVYPDRSTDRVFNTFELGVISARGVQVNGKPVHDTTTLPDRAVLQIGRFPLVLIKHNRQAQVQFRTGLEA